MSDWTVIPCLIALRDEYNALNPSRDKGADGTIGDSSHTSSSDHTPDEDSSKLENKDSDHKNEVHALDIDSSGPWPAGRTFKDIFLDVIELEREKWNAPDDKCRLNYAIFDKKIYDKDNDFEPQTYTGSDPHTNHAHFSARYETSCEEDTRPWGVIGDDMPTPQEYAKAVMDYVITMPDESKSTMYKVTRWNLTGTENAIEASEARILAAIDALPTANETSAAVVEAIGQDDPEALAAALRGVLTPEQVEALRLAL
jgi:hypothetical protein